MYFTRRNIKYELPILTLKHNTENTKIFDDIFNIWKDKNKTPSAINKHCLQKNINTKLALLKDYRQRF